METLWGSKVTRSQLQQSISNLKRLDELPEIPRENLPNLNTDPRRHLSVAREMEITCNLAFLSAISDDSLKIMAVCVEEHWNGKGITIRVASNTGDLESVTRGLAKLARELEHAAQRVRLKLDDIDATFREVVSLDFHRILSRLRSRHAKCTRKIAGKRPLIEQLHDAIYTRSIKVTASIKEGRSKARELQSLFARLESIPDINAGMIEAQELVGMIVRRLHAFSLNTNLGRALQTSMLDPSLKAHLPEAIGKVGRYYSATFELVCAARHRICRLFESIDVEPFQIQMPASFPQHLKVHAEIQLLFFYEAHPGQPRPRFICSSKSACYMCNLFFSLHGGFYLPRTHGRVYDKWTLPYWLDIPAERHEDLGRISTLLKGTIDRKVLRASNRKKRKTYHFPNESVLPLPASWSSSGISSKLSHQATTSTIQPCSQSVHEENSIKVPSQCTALPLTPPRTPPQADHADNSDFPVSDSVSSVTIGDKELPYFQLISLSTRSLHLELDTLSLALDFDRVASGRLSIAQVEDTIGSGPGYHVVSIENIPTASELQLDCLHDSNELTVQLQTARRGLVCMSFVWEEDTISAVANRSEENT
ncbi:hypothetical protein OIDMADRAFT_44371 [Oidiodendron maius Zn]|uniref:Uncharacterized protein n=1 Tax=Oidiodendron maius (strain Zn) TaxID=913774 RepID=A0A0C3GL17_OIDMZ|nr:hypothetical protein OIDMADRAFT_44371 [Oidiodendron maius Zn]